MTRDEAIREACRIMALVYRSIDDYTYASDGFCMDCPSMRTEKAGTNRYAQNTYRNDGKVFAYVRRAVLKQLKEDGYTIHPAFDPDTGEEIESQERKEST